MTKFVAEVSSNHAQNLNRCLDFINTSAEIGCHAVKFQLFKIDELFSPEILAQSEAHRKRKQWELSIDFLPELSAHAHNHGMEFSCTPFYLRAVEQLYPYVDFYKVASYELLWNELLIECAQTGKPVVVATGMATMEEVKGAVEILRSNNCSDITVLHCVSSYPAPQNDCNLKAIQSISHELGVKTGWSDHSVSSDVVNRAVNAFDATMIEFHLDIDGQGAEYKSGHCWLPQEIKSVIDKIEVNTTGQWMIADGDGVKRPVASELPDVLWRADPSDGLRPFLEKRKTYTAKR